MLALKNDFSRSLLCDSKSKAFSYLSMALVPSGDVNSFGKSLAFLFT
jgi:hypothetical protein